MPRDASGNYTLPPSNPVIDGTVIDVNWANPTLSDIAAQLNNVITRDGLLGFTNPILAIDGTAFAPGYSFVSATGTGIYRNGANLGVSIAGGLVAEFTPAGITLPGGKTFTGGFSLLDGTAAAPALAFANAPTTGMYRNTPGGELGFSVLGTERGRFHALGFTAFGAINAVGTMSASSTISGGNIIVVNHTDMAIGTGIKGTRNGVDRWAIRFGDETGEAGGNAGSNLDIFRFADDGAPFAQSVLNINRATGAVAFNTPVTFNGFVTFTGGSTGVPITTDSLSIGTPVAAFLSRTAANTLNIRIGDAPGPFQNYTFSTTRMISPMPIRAFASATQYSELHYSWLDFVTSAGVFSRITATAGGGLSFVNNGPGEIAFAPNGAISAGSYTTPNFVSAGTTITAGGAVTGATVVATGNLTANGGVRVKRTYSGQSGVTNASGVVNVAFPTTLTNPMVVVSAYTNAGTFYIATVSGVSSAGFVGAMITAAGALAVGQTFFWIAYEQ